MIRSFIASLKKVIILLSFSTLFFSCLEAQIIYAPVSNKTHSRRSESSFIKLKSGNILQIYSRFKASNDDHAVAELVKIQISPDGKRVLGKEESIIQKPNGNVMSPSLLRLQDGRIMLFYLQKEMTAGVIVCRLVMRYSHDECQTWSPETVVTKGPVYCVVVNDSVIQLRNGRICVPVSQYRYTHNSGLDTRGVVYCLYSDDLGKSWKESKSLLSIPDYIRSLTGYQEPVIAETTSGSLLMYMRTDLGYLYKTTSSDGGNTWSNPVADKTFPTVVAPAKIFKKSNNHLLMLFNKSPLPVPVRNSWNRSILSVKISKDNGKTWQDSMVLENEKNKNFAYPSLIEIEDGVFLCSYHMSTAKEYFFWHIKTRYITIK